MDSGSMALWFVGVLWVLFLAWVWHVQGFMKHAHNIHVLLSRLQDEDKDKADDIEERLNGMKTVYDEQFRVLQKACAVGPVERRVANLEKRTAGVEALLVSTVGQETEDFCRQMDAIMGRMEGPDKKQEPEEKLTLSEEYCGRFGRKKEEKSE